MAKDIQLHVFCAASELAYGALAYLKFGFELEKPHCSFVMSKNRLAPIKTISLPRLELNAAVLGVRLYPMIIKKINLPIQNVIFWTDSTLVLQYLRNQRHRFKVYVANRVTEILEMTTASQWHHIESKENPADICNRGVATVYELSNEIGSLKSWYKGPNFLWSNNKVETKLKGSKIEDLDENNDEIKTKCCFTNTICKVEPFIKFGI